MRVNRKSLSLKIGFEDMLARLCKLGGLEEGVKVSSIPSGPGCLARPIEDKLMSTKL
jgi:hypothetical protein